MFFKILTEKFFNILMHLKVSKSKTFYIIYIFLKDNKYILQLWFESWLSKYVVNISI